MEQQQRSKQGVTLVCNVFDSVIHVVVIYSRAKQVGKSKRRENVGAVKIEGFLGLSKYQRNIDVCKVEETKVKDGERERERIIPDEETLESDMGPVYPANSDGLISAYFFYCTDAP